MALPHALVVPFPAQGHVIPIMELSHCLVDAGFRVTFVNTEYDHERVVAAMSKKKPLDTEGIRLVAIPDGLAPGDNRNDLALLTGAIIRFMPRHLEELIRKMNESGDKITCVIADVIMAWALVVAKKMGLPAAVFCPASAGAFAAILSIPKLIEDGVIDSHGYQKKETFQLPPFMPHMSTAYFVWNHFHDARTQQAMYDYFHHNARAAESANMIICNSFADIELPVFTHLRNVLPVGPLLTGRRFGRPVGHFWAEEPGCTAWLDGQPAASVVYVAFGSFTVFGRRQFQELALGLELFGRPFLWVVRPDLVTDEEGAADFPPGFAERVAGRGKMVDWAPQQRVLAHPAVACFLSHCGWNSTMEGVTNGVPFLCWPYFGDQPLNRDYICDTWRTGLRFSADAEGIITREEIKGKLEALLGDEGIKERAAQLKAAARKRVEVGGASYENFHKFVETMKAG